MKTACPHCGRHYEVEDQFRDQTFPCPDCGKDFTIKDYISEEKKSEKTANPAEEKKEVPQKNYMGAELAMNLWGYLCVCGGSAVFALGLFQKFTPGIFAGIAIILFSAFGFAFAGILFYLRKIEENTRKK